MYRRDILNSSEVVTERLITEACPSSGILQNKRFRKQIFFRLQVELWGQS
jgi:hypothetical protein